MKQKGRHLVQGKAGSEAITHNPYLLKWEQGQAKHYSQSSLEQAGNHPPIDVYPTLLGVVT